MELNKLPDELLSQILDCLRLDKRSLRPLDDNPGKIGDLLNARLVCRKWNSLATKHAFRTIFLAPTEKGLKAWAGLLSSNPVISAARRVVIYSSSFSAQDEDYYEWEGWKDDTFSEFTDAMSRIRDLDLVDQICLRFTSKCVGVAADPDFFWGNDVEEISTRENTLKALFEAIRERAGQPNAAKIRSLTIKHLQNVPLPDFTSSELFKSVAKDLDQLHLEVAEEYNKHGPDHDIYCIELVQFEPYMQRHWLSPLADQLTSLTLNFGECWGTLPGNFNGRGLVFPQLKTLTLGSYAISHHDHLDWVVSQPSLKSLRLDWCFIVSFIRTEASKIVEWNVPTYDWERLPHGAFGFDFSDDAVYRFPGTWESVFDKIRTGLPNLVDFQFHISRSGPVCFDNPRPLPTKLSLGRYIVFDIGLCPSRWIEPNYDTGALSFGNHNRSRWRRIGPDEENACRYIDEMDREKLTGEGDTRAFDALLKATYERRC
ncbi:hypothetical protein BGZ61DRAFT_455279 [Ilyonectria robusta]|uniref:uncharacterized protein n=1 Tax=Ilyonectria robusta TaxID=1079257 RepID=UPI001E8E0D18|nr:uncharacterized protein BGZ61DRAFT_455279 [Ilyonectria robusta]KAH8685324.1 hypothetical protein BGZ61DRAFT_455279 [Ilyonectria robusta]